MAERFLLLEQLLTADGYECSFEQHPEMNSYFQLRSKHGNVRFGVGIYGGKLAVVRFSRLDGENGTIAVVSELADAAAVSTAIELLARGAVNANAA